MFRIVNVRCGAQQASTRGRQIVLQRQFASSLRRFPGELTTAEPQTSIYVSVSCCFVQRPSPTVSLSVFLCSPSVIYEIIYDCSYRTRAITGNSFTGYLPRALCGS